MLTQWRKQGLAGQLNGIHRLTHAFRMGCELHAEESSANGHEGNSSTDPFGLRILTGDVYNELMLVCLRDMLHMWNAFLQYEQPEEDSGAVPAMPDRRPKWSALKALVKSYFIHLVSFCRSLTDVQLTGFLLKHLRPMIPYAVVTAKAPRKLLKSLLRMWVGDVQVNRVLAFMCIHRLAAYAPYPFINDVLKRAFLTYAQHGKFANASSLPTIRFLRNCVVVS